MLKKIFIGLVLGFAGIIPGLSLGVIALVLNVYEDILESINNLFKDFKKEVKYLLPLAIGIILGFILGFLLLKLLLDKYLFYLSCAFVALMIISVSDVIKDQKKIYPLIFIGFLIPIAVTLISILSNVNNASLLAALPWWFLILTVVIGMAVGAAQIIPGLSATAIMMMLGLFKPTMDVISLTYVKNQPTIIIYVLLLIAGALIGVLVASKLINKLIKKYPTPSFNILFGISLGSIVTMIFNSDLLDIYTNPSFGILNILIGVIIFFIMLFFAYKLKNFKKNN